MDLLKRRFKEQADILALEIKEIIKEHGETVIEQTKLAQIYQVHPQLITSWKKEFLANAEKVFDRGSDEAEQIKKLEQEKAELIQQIGQLTVDNNWLKKKLL